MTAAKAMTPAPPTQPRAASIAPESKVEGLADGEPFVTVPLLPLGEETVPFPDAGATGAEVMVLVAMVLGDTVDDVTEVVVSTMLLAGEVLLA